MNNSSVSFLLLMAVIILIGKLSHELSKQPNDKPIKEYHSEKDLEVVQENYPRLDDQVFIGILSELDTIFGIEEEISRTFEYHYVGMDFLPTVTVKYVGNINSCLLSTKATVDGLTDNVGIRLPKSKICNYSIVKTEIIGGYPHEWVTKKLNLEIIQDSIKSDALKHLKSQNFEKTKTSSALNTARYRIRNHIEDKMKQNNDKRKLVIL